MEMSDDDMLDNGDTRDEDMVDDDDKSSDDSLICLKSSLNTEYRGSKQSHRWSDGRYIKFFDTFLYSSGHLIINPNIEPKFIIDKYTPAPDGLIRKHQLELAVKFLIRIGFALFKPKSWPTESRKSDEDNASSGNSADRRIVKDDLTRYLNSEFNKYDSISCDDKCRKATKMYHQKWSDKWYEDQRAKGYDDEIIPNNKDIQVWRASSDSELKFEFDDDFCSFIREVYIDKEQNPKIITICIMFDDTEKHIVRISEEKLKDLTEKEILKKEINYYKINRDTADASTINDIKKGKLYDEEKYRNILQVSYFKLWEICIETLHLKLDGNNFNYIIDNELKNEKEKFHKTVKPGTWNKKCKNLKDIIKLFLPNERHELPEGWDERLDEEDNYWYEHKVSGEKTQNRPNESENELNVSKYIFGEEVRKEIFKEDIFKGELTLLRSLIPGIKTKEVTKGREMEDLKSIATGIDYQNAPHSQLGEAWRLENDHLLPYFFCLIFNILHEQGSQIPLEKQINIKKRDHLISFDSSPDGNYNGVVNIDSQFIWTNNDKGEYTTKIKANYNDKPFLKNLYKFITSCNKIKTHKQMQTTTKNSIRQVAEELRNNFHKRNEDDENGYELYIETDKRGYLGTNTRENMFLDLLEKIVKLIIDNNNTNEVDTIIKKAEGRAKYLDEFLNYHYFHYIYEIENFFTNNKNLIGLIGKTQKDSNKHIQLKNALISSEIVKNTLNNEINDENKVNEILDIFKQKNWSIYDTSSMEEMISDTEIDVWKYTKHILIYELHKFIPEEYEITALKYYLDIDTDSANKSIQEENEITTRIKKEWEKWKESDNFNPPNKEKEFTNFYREVVEDKNNEHRSQPVVNVAADESAPPRDGNKRAREEDKEDDYTPTIRPKQYNKTPDSWQYSSSSGGKKLTRRKVKKSSKGYKLRNTRKQK